MRDVRQIQDLFVVSHFVVILSGEGRRGFCEDRSRITGGKGRFTDRSLLVWGARRELWLYCMKLMDRGHQQ